MILEFLWDCMVAEDREGKMVVYSAIILEGFVSNGCNFEFNPLPDGESMKFSKDRRNMMTAPNRRDDKPS